MKTYGIYVSGRFWKYVSAASKAKALAQWLDDLSYETLGEAARENFCKVNEIKAIEITTLELYEVQDSIRRFTN